LVFCDWVFCDWVFSDRVFSDRVFCDRVFNIGDLGPGLTFAGTAWLDLQSPIIPDFKPFSPSGGVNCRAIYRAICRHGRLPS
jgi:hypothetical protein